MKQLMRMALAALTTMAVVGLASAALAYDGEQFVTCNLNPDGDNFLALRTCGSSKCQMTHKLGPGTFLITTDPWPEGGWRSVIVQRDSQDWSYSGPSGWVYDKYICEIRY